MQKQKGNRFLKFVLIFFSMLVMVACASDSTAQENKQIVRIGHNQPQNHLTNQTMIKFKEHIESNLGDRYVVEVYPSELLGSQNEMVQLTQTGAIEVAVASNSLLEAFNEDFEIFNLPYLFDSPEAYHSVMNEPEIVDPIFNATAESGFITVAWLDSGTRNFYTVDTPIEEVSDLSGLKIRVQQSPTNVRMMDLLGGSATPMGFGDVYTAMQSGIIDGAENNELALTENGHGDVVNYFSYTMHQMIPDEVIANVNFLEDMSEEDRQIFEEGFQLMQDFQHAQWEDVIAASKDRAENEMGVEFLYPDIEPFAQAVAPLHEEYLSENPNVGPVYEQILEKMVEGSDDIEGGAEE